MYEYGLFFRLQETDLFLYILLFRPHTFSGMSLFICSSHCALSSNYFALTSKSQNEKK